MKNKKIIAIMLTVSVMLTGCVQSYEVEEQKKEVIEEEKKEITQEDIIKEFEPLFRLSEEEDFSYLYEEDYGFVDKFNPSEDIDGYMVSSGVFTPTIDTEYFEKILKIERINLDTNQRVAMTHLVDDLSAINEEYKIIMDYLNDVYIIRNNDIPNVAIEPLNNTKYPLEIFELSEEYLESLELEHWAYNPNLPSYILKYNLDENDINVQKIKELYPSVNLENSYISLQLIGSGRIGEAIYSQECKLEINSEDLIIINFDILAESYNEIPQVFDKEYMGE